MRLLFQKVQSPSLTQVKNALQVSYDLNKAAGEVTYNFLANSMAAEAAEAASLPDHAPNRQARDVDRHPTHGSARASGIKGPNAVIFTRIYKNFQSLFDNEKQAFVNERKYLNINPKKRRGGHSKKRQTSAIKVNKKSLSKMNKEFASKKARLKDVGKAKKSSSEDEDSNVQDNAGDQFGGH
jgi:hypothetical protein